jgi:TRAP-type C4-dicarboxylate transport system permease small subunit
MKRLISILRKSLETLTTLCFALLLLDVLWGVISRYVLGDQSRWTEEVAIYLLVWVTFLATPLAYHLKAHLGVDYLIRKLHPATHGLAAVAAHLCTLFFSAVVLVWGGFKLVSETLAANQLSPALDVPVGIFYIVIPLSGIMLCVFAINDMVKTREAAGSETVST